MGGGKGEGSRIALGSWPWPRVGGRARRGPVGHVVWARAQSETGECGGSLMGADTVMGGTGSKTV
jgi:hypothetical protein